MRSEAYLRLRCSDEIILRNEVDGSHQLIEVISKPLSNWLKTIELVESILVDTP